MFSLSYYIRKGKGEEMKNRFTGVFSIVLVFIALLLAIYRLFSISVILGIFYLIYIIVSLILILYFYCRKCPHVINGTCRHVLFGWITARLFKAVEPSPYTSRETLFTLLPLALAILLPQYWLFQKTHLFIGFWALVLPAVIMVLTSVCKGCLNRNCSLCPNRKG